MDEKVLTAGLFFGVFSLILWTFAPLGIAVSLAGLSIGIYGAYEKMRAMSIATVILSTVGLLLTLMNILIWGMEVSIQFTVS